MTHEVLLQQPVFILFDLHASLFAAFFSLKKKIMVLVFVAWYRGQKS
jgi:hypothetical protein